MSKSATTTVEDAILAVEKLDQFITKKLALLNELRYIQIFLKDAEEKQESDYRVRHWISDVRKIAEDTMFVLEEFYKTGGVENCGSVKKKSLLEWVRFHANVSAKGTNTIHIHDELASLKARMDKISKARESCGINTSYADAQQQQLLHKLLEDEPARTVVLICGTSGSGTTTLARSLYKSPESIGQFPTRIWTCVSPEHNNISVLLRTVSYSFDEKPSRDDEEFMAVQNMEVQNLECYLQNMLKDRRYLVVVDDVRTIKAWESLKRAFPDCRNGSRVIVTTCNKDVTTQLHGRVHVHHLLPLGERESWDLFMGRVSHGPGQADWCSLEMENLGREMVNKCGGLPLALIVLGGLLAYKQTLPEWQNIKDDLWQHLAVDSIDISHLLSLCYNHLPGKLKQCFLSIGTFRQDALLSAEHLKYLWMGEEFISLDEEMEDVAESYLDELINRGLIHVAGRLWGTIASCEVHDLLRDLAIEKAYEESFFNIYNPNAEHSSLNQHERHIVHTHIDRYLSIDHSNTRLRSLVLWNYDGSCPNISDSFFISGKYDHLYVLKLEHVWLPNHTLPESIGHLVQLKLLGLTGTDITSLPPSIGKLKCLQILEVIESVHSSVDLPPETSNLTSLRHLNCRIGGDIADIGALYNLRTLKTIHYEHWSVIRQENLVNLQELVIENVNLWRGDLSSLEAIGKLKRLHTLVLSSGILKKSYMSSLPLDFLSSCPNIRKLWLQGPIDTLPDAEKWPESLTMLRLSGSNLKDDPIPTLGKLPKLRCLELKGSHDFHTMFLSSGCFPVLEILSLSSMGWMDEFSLDEGALPEIKHVYVSDISEWHIPEELKPVVADLQTAGYDFESVYRSFPCQF